MTNLRISESAPRGLRARGGRSSCIVTTSDGHELRTFVSYSRTVDDALKEACRTIESWGAAWKIEAICTPGSIWRDLQGAKTSTSRTIEGANEGILGYESVQPWHYEASMLGRVGYPHLLTRRAQTMQSEPKYRRRLRREM